MASTSTSEPHDLRSFFRAVGGFSPEHALLQAPLVRADCQGVVEMLDKESSKVTSEPLKVEAFIDGIQSALCITYREHRPVYLTYTAAGAVGAHSKLLEMNEKLCVVYSRADSEWISSLNTSIPGIELLQERPDELTNAAISQLGAQRDTLERALVSSLVDSGHTSLLIDGSLLGKTYRPELVGVVKSHATKYLLDESALWSLPAGWRSARFKLPIGMQGSTTDRYSCYLRMHSAQFQAWNFGLIRLESFDPDLLDPLAALALNEKQASASRDKRYDRHLAGVRAVEDVLRARRPSVFTLV
jgi:hypothetical protein